MEKVKLGKTGLMVSRVGFGGIPIQRDTEEEAIAVVKRCIDLGITYLDTANGYTTSEGRIGKAIKGKRESLIISTKSLARDSAVVKQHLQNSLKQLGTDYIDLYQLHNISNADDMKKALAPGGPLSVVKEAKKAGVVRHIGVTSHQVDTAKEVVRTGEFETIMFPFNFVTCEPAEELLPLVRESGMGFIAMKPFDGGMIENATLAFKYLLQFPDIVPIPGMQKVSEVDEIVKIGSGSLKLTAAETKEMESIRGGVGKFFCRRCDYCQPCSSGIAISIVLDTKSIIGKSQPSNVFSGPSGKRLEEAANCIECGDCEKRCPYQLPIMQMVSENYKFYQKAKQEYLAQQASQ